MKLPIKKLYFDRIRLGKKNIELRDAHITFVCEETREQLTRKVISASVDTKWKEKYPDVLEDNETIVFELECLEEE